MNKKITAIICSTICAVSMLPAVYVNASNSESDLKDALLDAINWKEEKDSPMYSIGSSSSDFYIMALKRLGRDYDYSKYLSSLDGIAAAYSELHNASDMQRTALAAFASGGDPRNVGGRDLIADGVYYRNAVAPINREGSNGYSWGLIALDSGEFETPDWALTDRNSIIAGLLSYQNTDGSFEDSVYSTASAITALARYCDTSGAYTITQNQTGYVFDISPAEAVDKAVDYLEEAQSRDGDFGDLSSTAMAVIALDSIGIDSDKDKRFSAKNGTLIDGLLMYQNKDGGFSEDLNKSDSDATSLALCALTSHLRSMQNKSAFFSFNVTDTNVLATPTPTVKPSASTSSSSVESAARPTSTAKPTSTPVRTSKPAATIEPKKTTAPASSATVTPRPTKRPALVGPIEPPGPMPTKTPIPGAPSDNDDKSNIAVPAAIACAAVILLAAVTVVLYILNKRNTAASTVSVSISNAARRKNRRKTSERRRFEKRRKFNERRKYSGGR